MSLLKESIQTIRNNQSLRKSRESTLGCQLKVLEYYKKSREYFGVIFIMIGFLYLGGVSNP